MKRVAVIGAGLLGASVAYQIARRGTSVVVLEADRPAAGTSGRSFAWLNAQDKEPAWYFDLNVAGLRAYDEIRRELAGEDWYHAGGDLAIGWGAEGAKVRSKAERHAVAGYPVDLLPAGDLAVLEPAFRLPPDAPDVALAWYREEGWVEAPVLVGALLAGATRAGATVRTGTPVARLESTNAGAAVILASGERVDADHVVVAAGPASASLLATVGAVLPMSPSPGLLGVTEPASAGLRRVVHVAGSIAMRPDGGGRLLLAARGVDNALAPEMTSASADGAELATLLGRATAVMPGLAGARIETARIGIRSVPADGRPAVGPVPGLDGLYVVVSHSGATLAALLGRLAAEELVGREVPELAPCRLDRFVTA